MGKAVCGRFRVDLSGFGALAPGDFGSGVSGILSSWCRYFLALEPDAEALPGFADIEQSYRPNRSDTELNLYCIRVVSLGRLGAMRIRVNWLAWKETSGGRAASKIDRREVDWPNIL
jgi:hypothetical protein